MRAVSALADFVPRLSNPFDDISRSHHQNFGVDETCRGCHVSAEGTLMHAMRAWEWFVKELLTDLMDGRQTAHRLPVATQRKYIHTSKQDARTNLLRSSFHAPTNKVTIKANPARYLLTHNPAMVIAISQHWLVGSSVEQVFSGYTQQIERILRIRHGLSHGTLHAQSQARAAMITYAPLQSFTSIGEFLLTRESTSNRNYLESILSDLTDWAIEMSP